MNNKELQAARKLLMLDVSEAAELIGKVSARTWQYWESGRNAVPDDVDVEMHALLSIRGEMINRITDSLPDDCAVDLPFHTSFETFSTANPGKNRVQWRLEQSVAALFYTEGNANLV